VLRGAALSGIATVHVVVAGEGPDRDRLAALAAELGLGGRVHFLGQRDDVARVLHTIDVFALPSRFEGSSVALLEALAAGRACIVGDIPELTAVAGRAALAVTPGDAPAIAAALGLLCDASRRRALGETALAIAAAYDIDTVAARYTQVYRAVLQRKGIAC
jgi:glycosyltransferase involved in cell wall biosynthesis